MQIMLLHCYHSQRILPLNKNVSINVLVNLHVLPFQSLPNSSFMPPSFDNWCYFLSTKCQHNFKRSISMRCPIWPIPQCVIIPSSHPFSMLNNSLCKCVSMHNWWNWTPAVAGGAYRHRVWNFHRSWRLPPKPSTSQYCLIFQWQHGRSTTLPS